MFSNMFCYLNNIILKIRLLLKNKFQGDTGKRYFCVIVSTDFAASIKGVSLGSS